MAIIRYLICNHNKPSSQHAFFTFFKRHKTLAKENFKI